MKRTAKLLALVLALATVMTFGLTFASAKTVTGNAGANGGTITISNAVSGATYDIYRLLNFESQTPAGTGTTGSGVYKLRPAVAEGGVTPTAEDIAWHNWMNSNAATYGYTVDINGYVTKTDSCNPKGLADAALKYATETASPHIAPDHTGLADSSGMTFQQIALGYYLVDTNVGVLCGLDTTNKTIAIEEKNAVPAIDKKVWDEDKTGDDKWSDDNDADIGDTVNFKTTVTVGGSDAQKSAGAENYKITDTLSKGLTPVDGETDQDTNIDIVVKKNNTDVTSSNYTLTQTANTDGTTKFVIEFTKTFCETLMQKDVITVEYSAKVNKGAVIAGAGNLNETYLEYGKKTEDEIKFKTDPETTTTYVWSFKLFKFHNKPVQGQTPASEEGLSGAIFELYDTAKPEGNDTRTPIKFVQDGTAYRRLDATETAGENAEQLPVDSSGNLEVKGLDSHTYYLKEIKAPTNYTQLTKEIAVTIDKTTGHVSVSGDNASSGDDNLTVKVENKTGSLLPSTGSTGTKALVAIGSILVLVSVIFLVTKKKMSTYVA